MKTTRSTLILAVMLGSCGPALAQAAVKPDGQFRATLSLGASLASGNSDNSNLSITFDGVRATVDDKISLYAAAQYARTEDTTTAERLRLGGRYDRNLSSTWLAFGGLDLERNKFANLELRSVLSGGLGWHVIKSPATTWDLLAGLSYTNDRYFDPMLIDGAQRTSYDYAGLLLGEESTHVLTETTTAKQRLGVVPNLKNTGEYRANFDAGLAVSMTKTMSLNVGLTVSYNSEPGPGFKSTDTLLTMGVGVKFE